MTKAKIAKNLFNWAVGLAADNDISRADIIHLLDICEKWIQILTQSSSTKKSFLECARKDIAELCRAGDTDAAEWLYIAAGCPVELVWDISTARYKRGL